MRFSIYTPQEPNRDRKRCNYRCSCGRTEYILTLEVGDRKLKRWCKNCNQFIYPIAVTHIKTSRRELRTSKPRPSW